MYEVDIGVSLRTICVTIITATYLIKYKTQFVLLANIDKSMVLHSI